MPAKRWFIGGRVQGVGFRWFVERSATALQLEGYARNLDGRVEVYAYGASEALSELAGLLWQGPPAADVRAVEEREASLESVRGFRVERR